MAEYCSNEATMREMKGRISSWSENESQLKRPKWFTAVSQGVYLSKEQK